MELRDYQKEAITQLRQSIGMGNKRPILKLPTGSGKTVIAGEIIRRAVEKGKRVAFVVDRLTLIDQASRHLNEVGIDHGIIQADHPKTDWSKPVQVISVQTLIRRKKPYEFDIAINDEAHVVFGSYVKLMEKWNNIPFIGLSATPYTKGLGNIYDDLVAPISIQELIAQGFLVDADVYGPSKPDMAGVATTGGDFNKKQAGEKVAEPKLIASILETWHKLAFDKQTICFAMNIVHSKYIVDEFRCAGVEAYHIDAYTESEERQEYIKAFSDGEIRILSSVGVLCLDEETEILTRQGFIGIDDMTEDHLVAAWEEDGSVEFTKPLLIIRRDRFEDEDMVSVTGRQSPEIRVTSNHRMVIKKGGDNKKIKVMSAIEMKDRYVNTIPAHGECEPEVIHIETPKRKSSKAVSIRANSYNHRKRGKSKEEAKQLATQEVEERYNKKYKNPHELTEADCEFIGFWLGDGTRYRSSSGGERVSLAQSMAYPDIVEYIDSLLGKVGISYSRHIKPPAKKTENKSVCWSLARGTGGGAQARDKGWFEYGPYLNKKGSDLYWGLNKSKLSALLHGFWLADGNHHHDRGKKIVGTQIQLYDLLQAICSVRGIRATIKPIKQRNPRHSPQWKFAWANRKTWTVRKGLVKHEKEYSPERVWCVTSTTSYLIVRRYGKVFVTGNTTGFDAPNAECGILARPTKSLSLHIQMVGRLLRIYDGKDRALILDHAGNFERLGFHTDPTPVSLDKRKKGDKKPKEKKEALPKPCPSCHFMKDAGVHTCPKCGFAPEKINTIEESEGELKKIQRKKNREHTREEKQQFYSGLLGYAKQKGYAEGWAAHSYKQKFGVWPNAHEKSSSTPSDEVLRYVKYLNIRRAKSKEQKL